jgi:hypothetical protein
MLCNAYNGYNGSTQRGVDMRPSSLFPDVSDLGACVRVCVRACVRACGGVCACAGTFRALTLASASVRTMKWPDSPARPRHSQITREYAWMLAGERAGLKKCTLHVLRGTHGVRISGVGVSTRSGGGKKGIDRWLTRDAGERRHCGLHAVYEERRRSGAMQ